MHIVAPRYLRERAEETALRMARKNAYYVQPSKKRWVCSGRISIPKGCFLTVPVVVRRDADHSTLQN